jgi:hypothetical protein
MEIGVPEREIDAQPAEEPVPSREPVPEETPAEVPGEPVGV